MRHGTVAILGGLATAVAALVVVLPATASSTPAQVTTFDPTGATFTCPDTTYTVTGGIVQQVMRDGFDASGTEHVTGTVTPKGVTLTDGTTNLVYRLSGASWFGGSFDQATGRFVFTNTDHFNIIAPGGAVVGRVSGVEHQGSSGNSFSFDFGACQAPNG